MKVFKDISFWCIVLAIVVFMVAHHILSDKPLIEGNENEEDDNNQVEVTFNIKIPYNDFDPQIPDYLLLVGRRPYVRGNNKHAACSADVLVLVLVLVIVEPGKGSRCWSPVLEQVLEQVLVPRTLSRR